MLVVDNVGYHRSHRVWAWWERWGHRIRLLFLPPYTPHLNLMERIWRYVKEKLSCHRWWADWEALWEAMETLLSRLRVRFHSDQGVAIGLV